MVQPLELDAPVDVAGHNGLVGSAVWRRLEAEGFSDLVGWRSSEVDLRDRDATFDAVLSAIARDLRRPAGESRLGQKVESRPSVHELAGLRSLQGGQSREW